MESNIIGIATGDLDRKLIDANDAFLRLLGFAREDLLSGQMRWEALTPPEYRDVDQLAVEQLMCTGMAAPWEKQFIRKDGSRVSVLIGATTLVAISGETEAVSFVLDITGQKRMEQANQEWQKRLQLAEQAGLRIGFWDWDMAANTAIWSDETYRQFGYTRDTYSGRVEDAVARIHPDDRPKIDAAIRRVLAGAREYAAQYRVVRPDGTKCWIDAQGVVLRDKPTRMLGIGVDITNLKKTEQSLQDSEQKYRLLLNSTAEAIYGIDLSGDCTFCNPACLRLLGYQAPEELLGKNMHEVMHHTRADGTPYPKHECQIYVAVREGRASHIIDEVLWRADGTSFPAEYWSYPMLDAAGKVVGSVVTFLDITERIRAEQALRESEQKYRGLFENATHGIYRSKLDGGLLDVNPALITMLGYGSREELLTRNLDRDIYEDPAARRSILERYGPSGRVDGVEVNWKRKDGKIIAVRLDGGVVRKEDGSFDHFEVIVEDITERRRLEKQYRQAQKMEAVGQLTGGIAHDFNNLLGVIIGYSELFEEQLDPNDPLRSKAEQIKKAGQRAAGLTRQLLAFSRQQVLEPTILNLNGVVADTLKMLQRLIGEDIELVSIPAPDLGRVKADQGQIEQVILNLAVNARDAMPQGGKLTISTDNAEMDDVYVRQHLGAVPGSYVVLSVSDTGCGMDPETQAHIFEPFFTTKELGRGTGLGLATVYGVVKQSGGYISVYSEPGLGSTFKIYLPRVANSLTTSAPSDEGKEKARGWETILLVEDARALRELACELLEANGYTVLEAANGVDALRVAEKHKGPIHLLLSDVVMPGMDGRKLAEHLVRIHPETKVLYMSGYTDDAIADHGVLDSGIALLQRPFTRESLTRKVREILRVHQGQPGIPVG